MTHLMAFSFCLLLGAGGSSPQAEMDTCVSYLRFPVRHVMAPLSRLLVYYVRESGEGVTDSLQLPVQPSFENKVCSGKTLAGTLGLITP